MDAAAGCRAGGRRAAAARENPVAPAGPRIPTVDALESTRPCLRRDAVPRAEHAADPATGRMPPVLFATAHARARPPRSRRRSRLRSAASATLCRSNAPLAIGSNVNFDFAAAAPERHLQQQQQRASQRQQQQEQRPEPVPKPAAAPGRRGRPRDKAGSANESNTFRQPNTMQLLCAATGREPCSWTGTRR